MVFGAIGDTAYNIVLLLHILTAIVGFAPAFVHPMLRRQINFSSDADRGQLLASMMKNVQRIYLPSLLLTGLLGFALLGMSDDMFSASDGWVLVSLVIWLLLLGVIVFLIVPQLRAAAAGGAERSTNKRLQLASSAVHLMLAAVLVLMIWQPGN